MHGARVDTILKDQEAWLAKLFAEGLKPNELKAKLRRGKSYNSHRAAARTNSKGQTGRSARRVKGWMKHGKGPANVSH